MTEYIERGAVHRLIFDCKKYKWTSPVSSESHVTVATDDVNFGVDKIPVADVVPVRHGRWELSADRRTNWLVCSECRSRIKVGFDFCPNCGAKMDLEEEK